MKWNKNDIVINTYKDVRVAVVFDFRTHLYDGGGDDEEEEEWAKTIVPFCQCINTMDIHSFDQIWLMTRWTIFLIILQFLFAFMFDSIDATRLARQFWLRLDFQLLCFFLASHQQLYPNCSLIRPKTGLFKLYKLIDRKGLLMCNRIAKTENVSTFSWTKSNWPKNRNLWIKSTEVKLLFWKKMPTAIKPRSLWISNRKKTKIIRLITFIMSHQKKTFLLAWSFEAHRRALKSIFVVFTETANNIKC